MSEVSTTPPEQAQLHPQPNEVILRELHEEGAPETKAKMYVLETPPESEHRIESRELLYTTDPELTLQMWKKGPSALENVDPTELITVTNNTMQKFTVNPEGTFTRFKGKAVAKSHKNDVQLHTTPTEISEGGENMFNHPARYAEMSSVVIAFDSGPLWENIEDLHDFYAQLGIAVEHDEYGSIQNLTMPTPRQFMQRLESLRSSQNKFYVPEVRLIEGGHIPPQQYIEAFADGQYPVAVKDFYFYEHDVASEHLQALVGYGQPLMDLAQKFAKAGLEEETLTLSEVGKLPGPKTGLEKLKQVAAHLDKLTNQVSYLDLSEAQNYDSIDIEFFDEIIAATRQHGNFEEMMLVKAVLQKGIAKVPEEITAQMLVDELVGQVRERFGIQVTEPTTTAEPEPVGSEFDY